MKATGIIRRIDDLGRVVIPKEIRRNCHINEGDPLEIYVDNNKCVIFKKYSPCNDYVTDLETMLNEIKANDLDTTWENQKQIENMFDELIKKFKEAESEE